MGEVGTVETIVVSLDTHLLGVRVRAHLWIVSLHAPISNRTPTSHGYSQHQEPIKV